MGAPEDEHIFGVQLRESANDGSDFSNADADYRKVFLGEDGQLHAKDSAGTVTDLGSGGGVTVEDEGTPLATTATTLDFVGAGVTASGTGATKTITITGGGGGGETYDDAITGIGNAVHRWKFDEASGDFIDSIGSLDLADSGTITYQQAGLLGATSAALFGSSAKGQASGVGNIPTGSGDRAFAMIYRPTIATKQALYSYGNSGSNGQWWTLFVADGASNNLSLAVWADDLIILPLDETRDWHFLVARYSGPTTDFTRLFYDGHQVGVRGLGGDLNTGAGVDFRVGQDTTGGNQFNGYIDDLVVFDKDLTTVECERLWLALMGEQT